MFGFLKPNPVKKLERQYRTLLLKARDYQRNGKIAEYAETTAAAEAIEKQIEGLKGQS